MVLPIISVGNPANRSGDFLGSVELADTGMRTKDQSGDQQDDLGGKFQSQENEDFGPLVSVKLWENTRYTFGNNIEKGLNCQDTDKETET